jgi:uncharacterized glyoxalase superfamily protein PhnB
MVAGVPKLLDFLVSAFDAKVLCRQDRLDGSVAHAEAKVGESMLMLGEPVGQFTPMPTHLYLYVPDCDAVYQRALDVGGISVKEVTTLNFSGQRYGGVKDPSGNVWWIATHVEDVTPEEGARRFKEWQQKQKS